MDYFNVIVCSVDESKRLVKSLETWGFHEMKGWNRVNWPKKGRKRTAQEEVQTDNKKSKYEATLFVVLQWSVLTVVLTSTSVASLKKHIKIYFRKS